MIKYLFYSTFKNQKGTSLIEIIVSIFIVLLILQLTYIIILSAGQTVKSRNYTTANIFAVSLIEAIRTEGMESGFYQVNDSFIGITSPEGMEAEILISNIENRPFLKVVKVNVEWTEGNQAHQLELHSMIRKDL